MAESQKKNQRRRKQKPIGPRDWSLIANRVFRDRRNSDLAPQRGRLVEDVQWELEQFTRLQSVFDGRATEFRDRLRSLGHRLQQALRAFNGFDDGNGEWVTTWLFPVESSAGGDWRDSPFPRMLTGVLEKLARLQSHVEFQIQEEGPQRADTKNARRWLTYSLLQIYARYVSPKEGEKKSEAAAFERDFISLVLMYSNIGCPDDEGELRKLVAAAREEAHALKFEGLPIVTRAEYLDFLARTATRRKRRN